MYVPRTIAVAAVFSNMNNVEYMGTENIQNTEEKVAEVGKVSQCCSFVGAWAFAERFLKRSCAQKRANELQLRSEGSPFVIQCATISNGSKFDHCVIKSTPCALPIMLLLLRALALQRDTAGETDEGKTSLEQLRREIKEKDAALQGMSQQLLEVSAEKDELEQVNRCTPPN